MPLDPPPNDDLVCEDCGEILVNGGCLCVQCRLDRDARDAAIKVRATIAAGLMAAQSRAEQTIATWEYEPMYAYANAYGQLRAAIKHAIKELETPS
jgi:hypothetical protein